MSGRAKKQKERPERTKQFREAAGPVKKTAGGDKQLDFTKELHNVIKLFRSVQGIPVRACMMNGNEVGWFVAANDTEADEHEQFTLDILYGKGKFTIEQSRAAMAKYRKEHPPLTAEELELAVRECSKLLN